jgi:hypothetical protein
MSRDEMLVQLRSAVCRVVFTKVNGETRDMRCTLVRDMIPSDQTPKSTYDDDDLKSSLDVIRVFDLNANGWRSFKVANVIKFEIE